MEQTRAETKAKGSASKQHKHTQKPKESKQRDKHAKPDDASWSMSKQPTEHLDFKRGKRNVVLFCVGSFAPVHTNHFAMFEQAQEYVLSEHGQRLHPAHVVATFVAPTSEKKAKHKLKERDHVFASLELRCTLLKVRAQHANTNTDKHTRIQTRI